MTFTYDPIKATRNIRIHKISFDTAIFFFKADSNPDVEFDDDHSLADEARYRGTFRYNDHYLGAFLETTSKTPEHKENK